MRAGDKSELALLRSREDSLLQAVRLVFPSHTSLNTHKSITNLHAAVIRLIRLSGYIEIPNNDRNDHSQHNLCKILAAANTSAYSKSNHLLSHARMAYE